MFNNKIVYRILLCDDNAPFLNDLSSCLKELVSKRNDFTFEIDCAMQRGEIAMAIRDKTYDLISLDACYTNTGRAPQTTYECLRLSVNDSLYGVELYLNDIKKKIDINVTKVLIVSKIDIDILRRNFNYDSTLDFFCKRTINPNQIANHILNYFVTDRTSFYNDVFVVYGHNTTMHRDVENHLHQLNIHSIDLYHESSGGLNSFIDSLTDVAKMSQCAIILLSADDITLNIDNMEMQYRARQNVIFEMGLFLGKLGKDKILVLHEQHKNFEFPSDIQGIFYISYDESNPDLWKNELNSRLRKIGFNI